MTAAVTDDAGAPSDSAGSFFTESAATATDLDDDPLAAMARKSVDRFTDGDGAN